MVWSTGEETYDLPITFLKQFFVSPIMHSPNPPNHGVFLGINFHTMPCDPSVVSSSSDCNNAESSSAAAAEVDALSDCPGVHTGEQAYVHFDFLVIIMNIQCPGKVNTGYRELW